MNLPPNQQADTIAREENYETDSTKFESSGKVIRMGIRSKIGNFVRWIITWPVLVIVALNLENAASQAGYSMVINEHWKDAFPVLTDIYQFATSHWVSYPVLIIFGATIYEWVLHFSGRLEKDGSRYQRWLITNWADVHASAYFKSGFSRNQIKDDMLHKYNQKLEKFELPLLPTDFSGGEQVNAVYGSYLMLLSKGQFDLARTFVLKAIQDLESGHE